MSFDTLRVYEAGRFYDMDLPDWYEEACRISETERVDWHRAFERVLECEYPAQAAAGEGAGVSQCLAADCEVREGNPGDGT